MTRGITGREPDPREVYGDIIDLPHHVSDRHPQMSLYDRAAQFAPYAALAGYHDLVNEEARLVDNRIELSSDDLEQLNRKLARMQRRVDSGKMPLISVTYFIPDPLKAGGRYETVTEKLRMVDSVGCRLILDRKVGLSGSYMEIPISDVLDIQPGG